MFVGNVRYCFVSILFISLLSQSFLVVIHRSASRSKDALLVRFNRQAEEEGGEEPPAEDEAAGEEEEEESLWSVLHQKPAFSFLILGVAALFLLLFLIVMFLYLRLSKKYTKLKYSNRNKKKKRRH